jgi:single-stranded-DNA-specific exonuclease
MTAAAIVRRAVPDAARVLVDAGVAPVLARIYAARGVASPQELDHALARLPAPGSLKGIDDAVARLARAIAARERIVIVADYDADGATACAVGVSGLRALGGDVDFVVPNRFEFGYGLTPEIVALAAQRMPRLLVTVDNGISSHDGVADAAARGIDVLVTDHHLPAATLPSPAIIVNPNQPGCGFPSRNLAGVGVMFYVLLALRAHLRSHGAFAAGREPHLGALLDLVALGTVADVVRLDHVNRILVEQGLARVRAGRARPGVAALFRVAGRDPQRATSLDLGFVAAPRLNAAGRMDDMSLGIRCLLADTDAEALSIAGELDALNRERRSVEATMHDEALAALERVTAGVDDEAYTICIHQPQWHAGVVGIVASRLKDHFHRPAIVFATAGDATLKGSGRSIAGFHLRDALDRVAKEAPGTVERFGGHAFAAGVSMPATALGAFAEAFERVARTTLDASQLHRVHASDGALPRGELTFELARTLRAGIWGQGLPAPAFDDTFAVVEQRAVGERHRRLILARDGERFEAIVFNETTELPERVRALYRPEVSEWNGLLGLELVVDHWQPAG